MKPVGSAESSDGSLTLILSQTAWLLLATILWITLSSILNYDSLNPLVFGAFLVLTIVLKRWELVQCALLIFLWSLGDLYTGGMFQKIPS
jgi:hypothetical protein